MEKSNNKWIARVEGVLLRVIIVCITALLISQILMLKEGTRIYLSKVDKMEGEQITSTIPLYADTPLQITEETTVVKNYQNLLRKSKIIIIHMVKEVSNPNIYVLVNGKVMDNFSKGDIKLTVYDGDYVEIDSTAIKKPVQMIIKVPDKGLISPMDGLVVDGTNRVFAIGKIKFKN